MHPNQPSTTSRGAPSPSPSPRPKRGVAGFLAEALAQDPALVLVAETFDGVDGSRAGLVDTYPERVLTVPIADRGAMALALGMAMGGHKVLIELADATRLAACTEVLYEAAALAHAGEFPVSLVVRVPWRTAAELPAVLLDENGPTVVVAASSRTLVALLRGALGNGPVVVLEPTDLTQEAATTAGASVLAPVARVVRQGAHATVVAVGGAVATALEAAEQLAAEGVEVDVIDLVALTPIDRATIGACARRTGRILVVTDSAAIGQRVRQIAVDEAFLYFEAPLATLGTGVDAVVAGVREAVSY